MTEGYGADKGKSYPDYLSQKVNIPVVNLGRTGMTAEEAVEWIAHHGAVVHDEAGLALPPEA